MTFLHPLKKKGKSKMTNLILNFLILCIVVILTGFSLGLKQTIQKDERHTKLMLDYLDKKIIEIEKKIKEIEND